MEYELLHLGLRFSDLGSKRLTWHDLAVILAHPRPGLPLYREIWGESAKWADINSQLLAAAVDTLAVANWQRQGDRNAPRPEPIPRPGVEGFSKAVGAVSDEDAYTMDELDSL